MKLPFLKLNRTHLLYVLQEVFNVELDPNHAGRDAAKLDRIKQLAKDPDLASEAADLLAAGYDPLDLRYGNGARPWPWHAFMSAVMKLLHDRSDVAADERRVAGGSDHFTPLAPSIPALHRCVLVHSYARML